MVKEFKIILDSPSAEGTVLSGSEVRGTVLVRIEEPKKYQCIKIFLRGKSYTRETYVDLEELLWDKSLSPSPNHVLPAGEHRFPFQFTLPSSSPSSYEGRIRKWEAHTTRWIRYSLEATISYARLLQLVSKHTIKTPLQVTQAVDINTPELDKPLQLQKQKIFSGLWSISGPVNTVVEVPRTGYCIGEVIPFRITVVNGSNRKIECVARLREQMLFTTQSTPQQDAVFHGIVKSGPIESHTTSTWAPEDSPLRVPTFTPVSIDTKTIKRCFYLDVLVFIPCAKSIVISLPVTIGNVPYRQEAQALPLTYACSGQILSTDSPATSISELNCDELSLPLIK